MTVPRYSLRTTFLLVTALCLLLAFPRYLLMVSTLFLAVLAVLALIGYWMGPLAEEKLEEYRRLSSRKERDEPRQ